MRGRCIKRYNRAYLASMADAVIDLGNKIAIICELEPHFTDTVTDTLSQINKYKVCLADEPLHDQNRPKYRNEFWIKKYEQIFAVILTYDTNTEYDEFLKSQGVGVYHISNIVE
jgi:hypothetical protein